MPMRTWFATLFAASMLWTLPAAAQDLPEGKGKEIVASSCVGCHELNRVTGSGYTLEDWRNVLAMMVNIGVPLEGDQLATVSEYLIKNYPERPKPPAAMVSPPTPTTVNKMRA